MRKTRNVFAFFKSILPLNLAISTVSLLLTGISEFIITFITFGFIFSLAMKQFYKKSEYIYYYNNGLSRTQLWVFSYFMVVIFALASGSAILLLKLLF